MQERGGAGNQDVAANNVQKPDIWAARDVTFTAADNSSDPGDCRRLGTAGVGLFRLQAQDLHRLRTLRRNSTPMGWPLTSKASSAHGQLMLLTAEQQAAYPSFRRYLKGFSILQQAIDSPGG